MLDLLWHKKDVRIWKTKEHGALNKRNFIKKWTDLERDNDASTNCFW